MVSDRLVVLLAFVFRSLNDQKVARMMQVMLRRRLAETELAPALAALLEVLRQHDLHQDLFDTMVEALRGYIVGHSRQIAEIVEERSDWWVQRRVDRRVATAITEGVMDYLDGIGRAAGRGRGG